MEANNNIQSCELPELALRALDKVSDPLLHDKIVKTLEHCRYIVKFIEKIHLPQDEISDDGRRVDDSVELRNAAQFLDLVKLIQNLLAQTNADFPHEETQEAEIDDDAWDLEFDLVDTDRPKPNKAEEQQIVPIEKQITDTIWALGSMLSSKLEEFAGRLEFALGVNDPWVLWAELDDYSHKMLKGVLAIYFSILGFYTDESRVNLLPEYSSSVQISIDLRREIAELTQHIDRFNSAIAKRVGADCIPYVVALSDRLTRFSQRPAYRNLRTQDKQEFINFKREIFNIRHSSNGINTNKLRLSVEGFSKFLESLHAINQREVLILHDKHIFQQIQTESLPNLLRMFQEDDAAFSHGFTPIMKQLATIYGRDPELDKLISAFENDPDKEYRGAEGFSLLQEIHRLSRSLLATLG